jgi:rubredoxin
VTTPDGGAASPAEAVDRDAAARYECGICWAVYDPAMGDEFWQVRPGTAFAALPAHWCCPNCDAPPGKFMRLEGPAA